MSHVKGRTTEIINNRYLGSPELASNRKCELAGSEISMENPGMSREHPGMRRNYPGSVNKEYHINRIDWDPEGDILRSYDLGVKARVRVRLG